MTEYKKCCYNCEKEFTYKDEDTYNTCDTIEGQYTEWSAVLCPHCHVENEAWGR